MYNCYLALFDLIPVTIIVVLVLSLTRWLTSKSEKNLICPKCG